jgi:hypothetical protein
VLVCCAVQYKAIHQYLSANDSVMIALLHEQGVGISSFIVNCGRPAYHFPNSSSRGAWGGFAGPSVQSIRLSIKYEVRSRPYRIASTSISTSTSKSKTPILGAGVSIILAPLFGEKRPFLGSDVLSPTLGAPAASYDRGRTRLAADRSECIFPFSLCAYEVRTDVQSRWRGCARRRKVEEKREGGRRCVRTALWCYICWASTLMDSRTRRKVSPPLSFVTSFCHLEAYCVTYMTTW